MDDMIKSNSDFSILMIHFISLVEAASSPSGSSACICNQIEKSSETIFVY